MTISFKVSENTKNELNEFYQDLKREKTPPYATFQAQDGETVVTLYDSGKIIFQGRDADLASDFWIATEKKYNSNIDIKNSDKKNEKSDKKEIIVDQKIYNSTAIGSDEVGTGDYFGPIVVSAAYVRKEDIKFLENLGVKDSKQMNDNKIMEIVPIIKQKIPYESIILTNKEYNKYYNSTMNMNKIKAILHNKVLTKLSNEYPNPDYIIVDEFAKEFIYYNYLKEIPNYKRGITFLTKGETRSLAVACASLISRYIFLEAFDKLSESVDIFLPKGASNLVDDVGIKIVEKYGVDKLEEIAKLNFKNTEKIKKGIN